MQQQSNVIAFLQEFIARLFIKSPLFFKVWTIISGALVLLTGVPQMLGVFGVHLPDELNNSLTKAIGWAARGIFIMSMLTTQSKPAAITEGGQVLKKTDNAKLPFTEKSETKAAGKLPDIPVVENLPIVEEAPKQPFPPTQTTSILP